MTAHLIRRATIEPAAVVGGPYGASVNGLMWFDASQEVVANGTLIDSLTDRSGAGNHSAASTGATRATLTTAVINGKAVYRFNRAQAYNLANVFSALTSGEVFLAVKLDADPPSSFDWSGLWHFGTNTDSDHYPFTDGVIYDGWGSTARKTAGNPTLSLAAARIYNVSSAPGAWTARLDGTQLFTTATNTVAFTTVPKLGKGVLLAGSTHYWLDGDIGELIVFGQVLSSGDRSTVLAGMKAKWGIA